MSWVIEDIKRLPGVADQGEKGLGLKYRGRAGFNPKALGIQQQNLSKLSCFIRKLWEAILSGSMLLWFCIRRWVVIINDNECYYSLARKERTSFFWPCRIHAMPFKDWASLKLKVIM
jgi:hypothetical protein